MKFYDFSHIFGYVYVQWLYWPCKTQKVIFFVFHRKVNTKRYIGATILLKEVLSSKVCTQLAINLHWVHSYSCRSQYFCQLVLKYPLFHIKYSSRTWWYISTVTASQVIWDCRLCVVFSKRKLDFCTLSYYYPSFFCKFNWFPVISFSAQLLFTPKHMVSSIHPAHYSLLPNFPSSKSTETQMTSYHTWW